MKQTIRIIIALCFALPLTAQDNDLATIDGMITELYAVISGPAGERDWDKFKSLFTENATMGAMTQNSEGKQVYRAMTPTSYVANNGPFFKENGFWETEIGREVHQFGELAHVFTAYQFVVGSDPNGEVATRGINSVQMIYEKERWWIVSIQWNAERDDNRLPAAILNK